MGKLRSRQPVHRHGTLGDGCRRPRAAVEQRHLATHRARAQRGDQLLGGRSLDGRREAQLDLPTADQEDLVAALALLEQHLAVGEVGVLEVALQRLALGRRELVQAVDAAQPKLAFVSGRGQHVVEDTVLGVGQRPVDPGEDPPGIDPIEEAELS